MTDMSEQKAFNKPMLEGKTGSTSAGNQFPDCLKLTIVSQQVSQSSGLQKFYAEPLWPDARKPHSLVRSIPETLRTRWNPYS